MIPYTSLPHEIPFHKKLLIDSTKLASANTASSTHRGTRHLLSKLDRIELAWAKAQRAAGNMTIPSTIAEELATNPFMRVHEPTVQQYAQCTDPVEVLATVRQRKNFF